MHRVLSDRHYGFLRGKGREIQLWMYKIREAINMANGFTTEVWALDMHHAFDTVKRGTLMDVVMQSKQENGEPLFTEDEERMIRVLLAPNISRVRVGRYEGEEFEVSLGTPIGDCLSPLLFLLYETAALKRAVYRWVSEGNVTCSDMPMYADDVDFFHNWTDQQLEQFRSFLVRQLEPWGLRLSESKEERYTIPSEYTNRLSGNKKSSIKKLGVYLNQKVHVRHVIKQVKFHFKKNWPLWHKPNKIPKDVKMSLYHSLILPHFMNGMFLFPLTDTQMHALNVLHR